LKPITHARKRMMLEYFGILESQLRLALKEAAAAAKPTTNPAFIELVAGRVFTRMKDVAAGIPEAAPPSLRQISKNLENVLDAAAGREANSDPMKAIHALREELRRQPEYTPREGGTWQPASQVHRRKAR
jgi:hypothetical protein